MALNYTPQPIGSGLGSETVLDENFTGIDTALEDGLSRSGQSPNSMTADLDMNSQQIINLPQATATGHPVTFDQWITNSTISEFTGYNVEEQTATAGQTAFTLATAYTPGISSLRIYINGVYQAPSSYVETSTTVITFSSGLDLNDTVSFVVSSFDAAGSLAASAVTYLSAGVGAVQTNVQTKLRESVSVEDFGAIGDGVTDDTAAINAALASMTSGGVVNLGVGTFLISSNLNFLSDTTFRGAGMGATTIKTASGADGVNQLRLLSVSNILIEDLKLDGSASTATAGSGVFATDAININVNKVRIDEMPFHGVAFASVVPGEEVRSSSITNCYITECKHRGMNLSPQTNNVLVANNRVSNCGKSAISFGHGTTTDIAIIGNLFDTTNETVNRHMIHIIDECSRVSIVGNTIKNATGSGIGIHGFCTDFVISGNIIISNDESGILLHAQDTDAVYAFEDNGNLERFIISGNLIEGNGANGILFSDDTLGHVTKNVTITGNSIILNGGWGITETLSAGLNNIFANHLVGNTSGEISPPASGTKVRNNDGFVTENSGTGSVLSTFTTDVINHGLDVTPAAKDIRITFTEQGTNDYGRWWVDTITSTQFTLNVSADPGASNLNFSWQAIVL